MPLYGRDDEEWERLTDAALDFLVECARLETKTTYKKLNAALVDRTGLRGFDFSQPSEPAAIGHLLYLAVERNLPESQHMISALVVYEGRNDAGRGFYTLAKQLGLLRSGEDRTEFWVSQVQGLYEHYRRSRP
ncbi:hypothetical protein LX15_005582 [Streptoalloteichus tenebrarius]|uniref:Uncharacterized protein n=1 Tax=Streptoalloteichus tenebrarius (strain ATCC 17920 / DSM 40477 / JCM 4838 / CBS 697.72 / NBRC 16177 / NCIMB 11028 / NRRL B-12390 / A12253. 1 / ISP 5477) TaxID=1933 RepID=A0ABT1I243_STRSD|nr:hypothetical protein [Streptoalloteichus tenebrarius]MCP2261855.1 hypothetical protein [Streptoalloteichus tenebrarius]BFF00002.1 hypothetical protein GCM10020241_16770 [Streptoalloteichus tenebrarius]